jgi:DNA-directed RNA polymerase beta subunit/DNA-directed RNA polymerase beta' subunit
MDAPDILSVQLESYLKFSEQLKDIIQGAFPWTIGQGLRLKLTGVRSLLALDEADCFRQGVPYQMAVLVDLELVSSDEKTLETFKNTLLGFIPALTSRASLFYGKTTPREKVIVAQIVPLPHVRLAKKVQTILKRLQANKSTKRFERREIKKLEKEIEQFNKNNGTKWTLKRLASVDIADLKNYRVRMIRDLFTEAVSHALEVMKRYFEARKIQGAEEVAFFVIPSLPQMFTWLIEDYLDNSGLVRLLNKINPLDEVSRKREFTFCGHGGIRDLHGDKPERHIHPSHFGRFCPLETPESAKVGLTLHLALGAVVKDGVIKVGYRNALGRNIFLSPQEESKHVIAPADYDRYGVAKKGDLLVREQPTYREHFQGQFLGVAAALIPFIAHDDMYRAAMGAKYMQQALPLLHCEPPLIKTGWEEKVGRESRLCVIAEKDGILKEVSEKEIVVLYDGEEQERRYPLVPVLGVLPGVGSFYRLPQSIAIVCQCDGKVQFVEQSKVTVQDSIASFPFTYAIPKGFKICVKKGSFVQKGQVLAHKEKVKAGEVLADASTTVNGELALGVNLLVAYMPWYGWNFEDAVVVSERAAELLTSLHLEWRDGELILVPKKLQVGDKLSNRHGNKGVVSKILPTNEMPKLQDGTPVDILLNPNGVISRMNIGQLLETHWGWVAKKIGKSLFFPPFCPVNLDELRKALEEAGLREGKAEVTWVNEKGKECRAKVVVGYQYFMKLCHLAEDKFHVRTKGRTSIVTLQPPKGKKRDGGQRLGEMEVWAIQAYKAEKVLEELLTYRADVRPPRDDQKKKVLPESFRVLIIFLRGLGIDVRLIVRDERGEEKEFPVDKFGHPFNPAGLVRIEVKLADEERIKKWGPEVRAVSYEEKRYRCPKCGFYAYEGELRKKKVKPGSPKCPKCQERLEVEIVPNRYGLFGNKIFGDEKNREKMGHIKLVIPIPHPLFPERKLRVLPVIPPAYRPRLRDIGGLSDHYQRILYWNDQLKRLKRKMKREGNANRQSLERQWSKARAELVRSVARLFGMRAHIKRGAKQLKVSYKSLPRSARHNDLRSLLEGKEGLLRGFLLGKRLDFSGRAVIVPDPTLPFGCFRLPWEAARRFYNALWGGDKGLLEEVYKADVREKIKESVFLLNRSPTLHRYNVQAFTPDPKEPFWDHKVIGIHPLVCGVYNADFDGDTMAFYYLEGEAAEEAKLRMAPIKNLFSVANGHLTVHLAQDIVAGLYLLSQTDEEKKRLSKLLEQPDITSYTSPLDKRTLRDVVEKTARSHKGEMQKVLDVLDQIMRLGFKMATEHGLSFSVFDLPVLQRNEVLDCFREVSSVGDERERTEKLRQKCGDKIWEILQKLPPHHPVAILALSGARGDKLQLARIGGAVLAKENSPLSCYVEGLSELEYFFAAMETRRDILDKKLGPAETGYLMRKLVYCAYPVTIVSPSCEGTDSLKVPIEPLQRLIGRVVAEDLDDILKKGDVIERRHIDSLRKLKEEKGVTHIRIYSPLTCAAKNGVCQRCYGWDLSQPDGNFPEIGLPVGIIAAQSIGERGTQEMMRTFHGALTTVARAVLRVKEFFDHGAAFRDKNDLSNIAEKLIEQFRNAYENAVDDRHFEVILRQMKQHNSDGTITFRSLTQVGRSLKEQSFLAAASFDSTISVLKEAAQKQMKDTFQVPPANILVGFHLNLPEKEED